MQGGDLSDRRAPRWLLQWEGVLGTRPAARDLEYRVATRFWRWDRAARTFDLEPHVLKVVNDLYWRRDLRFDVWTGLGQEFAEAVARRLDREYVPVTHCLAIDPDELAARLVYMPDVQLVVHAFHERPMVFGPRGLYVTDPGSLSL